MNKKKAHWTSASYQLNTVGVVLCSQTAAHMCLSEPHKHLNIHTPQHTHTHTFCFKVRLWNASSSYDLPAREKKNKNKSVQRLESTHPVCLLAVTVRDVRKLIDTWTYEMAARGKWITLYDAVERIWKEWFLYKDCCDVLAVSQGGLHVLFFAGPWWWVVFWFFLKGQPERITACSTKVSVQAQIRLPKMEVRTDSSFIQSWWHMAIGCHDSSDVLHHTELRTTKLSTAGNLSHLPAIAPTVPRSLPAIIRRALRRLYPQPQRWKRGEMEDRYFWSSLWPRYS